MNAAFLLVTTAWLAGDTAADAKGAAPAPAANACSAGCCNTGCCGGHEWGQRLRDCLRNLCHRDCCEPCPAPKCEPAPRCDSACCGHRLFQNCFSGCGHNWFSGCGNSCSTGCGHSHPWFSRCGNSCGTSCNTGCGHSHPWFSGCGHSCAPRSCAPACGSSCDSCGHGCQLLERLRACFHRNDCCNPCGGTSVMPKAGETINTPPKKMPSTGGEPPAKEVRIDTPPALDPVAPAIQQPAAPPAPPVITPGVSNDNLRSPF